MTPAARVAAAIEVLDDWLAGGAAERLLTTWARKNRYAGSKDRAAIRDLVFEALRCQRSFAALGGAETGRGMMIGALRAEGRDPGEVFTGEGYAPAALAAGELPDLAYDDLPDPVQLDTPDWLLPQLSAALGDDFARVMAILRHRAPVFLRVNLLKATLEEAQAALGGEGIETRCHPLSPTALEVIEGARKINNSRALQGGLVELQDVASQALVDRLNIQPGQRVVDYCAGGGGKALAMAALGAQVRAHDIDAGRMADLPQRAARAGAEVKILSPGDEQAMSGADLIFADAPCSGSGAWRRSPEGKWRLTAERIDELCAIQASILDEISNIADEGCDIAYATCSLLSAENDAQIAAFLARHPDWHLLTEARFTPMDGGDGFYVARLSRTRPGD